MKRSKRKFWLGSGLLAAFLLWTAAVSLVDVKPIGPLDSVVGFSALNRYVHELTGVHWGLYTLTDWLGLVPLGVCTGFAGLGLKQWIERRSIRKVDGSILVLGGFYAVVMAMYVLFEIWAVNYRPVLINGCLEASYPSSTTMLALCVIPTAMLQLKNRIKKTALRKALILALSIFTAFMVIGRMLSGVHWISDIIGGILLSSGLVALYDGVCEYWRV